MTVGLASFQGRSAHVVVRALQSAPLVSSVRLGIVLLELVVLFRAS
ncbi:MAG: hypothetical protein JNN27_15150 [Planctomycetes bacterium]|nr:hypothetical protein [Planctomycetota bacterium]